MAMTLLDRFRPSPPAPPADPVRVAIGDALRQHLRVDVAWRRVRIAAAHREQPMSKFGHDAIMAEVERVEAERQRAEQADR